MSVNPPGWKGFVSVRFLRHGLVLVKISPLRLFHLFSPVKPGTCRFNPAAVRIFPRFQSAWRQWLPQTCEPNVWQSCHQIRIADGQMVDETLSAPAFKIAGLRAQFVYTSSTGKDIIDWPLPVLPNR